ncbi:DMT family transporter [Paenibacillus elgii]|uniref:DMT family transporter n=1 Tax=Paenibacillus elgii TaxID=189691 RepID=UPI0030DC9EC2
MARPLEERLSQPAVTTKRGSLPVSPYALLFVGVFSVALSSIFIKWSSAPASIMGMYRLLFTIVLLLPFRPWKQTGGDRFSWSVKGGLLLVLSGLFLGLHFLFWMESLKHTSVASSMILLTLQPVFIMIGSFFLFKERTSVQGVASLVVALVGSVLIGWGDIGFSGQALYGDLLSIAGALSYSLYLMAGQKLMKEIPSMLYSLFVFIIAALLLFVFNVFNHYTLTDYTTTDWGIFVLLALIPTVMGQMLFNWLLAYVNATTVSMAVIGEPVLAIILAYLLLNEQPTWLQAAGGLLTMLGVGIYFRIKPKSVQK